MSASSFKKLGDAVVHLLKSDRHLDEIKINQGRILAGLNGQRRFAQLSDYEFKVFSQWGEDGIIQFLVSNLSIKNKTFIEFGVEDFSEANCRFLLMKDYWSGFVIDGSPRNMERLQSSYFFWKYQLQCKASFITRENVNSILEQSGFDAELGILSIDIDGVDYHVLDVLSAWRPSVLIVEYNALFGAERAVSVPYDPQFLRSSKHYSNLYYGASLPAFLRLAQQRGYALVGVNGAGSNAFFVRRELLTDLVKEVALPVAFRDASFRESRNERGNLTFLSGHGRRRPIAEMPLVDVVSGEMLRVGDLWS